MIQYVHLMRFMKPSHLQICKKFYSLYYFHTRNLFLLAFVVSITNQFMGDAVIFCNFAQETAIPEAMITSFCYLNGTHTVVNGTRYYHHYYKWISIVLLLEMFAFYMPYFVWGNYIRSYIESVTYDKNENPLELNETRCKYILNEIKNSKFCIYYKHLFLEVFFFVNVIVQFALLHVLLMCKFITFGFDILFPYNTNCDLSRTGVGGNRSELRLRCNLPLNILYKRIFIAMYFWFWFLILSNLVKFGFDTYKLMTQKFNCNQWLLFKIVKWNITGEDKKYVVSEMSKLKKSECKC